MTFRIRLLIALCTILIGAFWNNSLAALEIRLIKQASCSDLGLLHPSGLWIDQAGIVVYDRGKEQFLRFNHQLEPIARFGRAGEGPGEFVKPVSCGTHDTGFWVIDQKGKLLLFDFEGQVIREEKAKNQYFGLINTLIWLGPQDRVVQVNEINLPRSISKHYLLRRGNQDIPLCTSSSLSDSLYRLHTVLMAKGKQRLFVVADSQHYDVAIMDWPSRTWQGRVLDSSHLRIAYNESEKAEMKKRMDRILTSPHLSQFKIRGADFTVKPAIDSVFADEQDRLFVVHTHKAGPSLAVYDKAGIALGESTFVAHAMMAFGKNLICAISEKEDEDLVLLFLMHIPRAG